MDFEIMLPEKDKDQHSILQKLKGYPERLAGISAHFNADFFHLENSEVWGSLGNSSQISVLHGLAQEILKETLHIEMAGMAYASKMSLLSENIDQRQVFCEFSAQESKHFEWVRPYVSELKQEQVTDFANFVNGIVKSANFMEGLLLVQTTLEGWGLHYYQELQKGCSYENLRSVFTDILKDEAKHHSGGIAMLGKKCGTDSFASSRFVFQTLQAMAESIAVGPMQMCDHVLAKVVDPDPATVEKLLEEVQAEEVAHQKMDVFKRLLSKCLHDDLMAQWDRLGMFRVYSQAEMSDLVSSKISKTRTPAPENSIDLHL